MRKLPAMDSDEAFTCPYCSHTESDFHRLQDHVQSFHFRRRDQQNEQPQLDDFELAQLLAFEEAGLPAELALSDRSDATARKCLSSTPASSESFSVPTSSNEEPWAECFCGEVVLFRELDMHCDMHALEAVSLDEPVFHPNSSSSTPRRSEEAILDITNSFTTTIPQDLRNIEQVRSSTPRSERRRPSIKDYLIRTQPSRRELPIKSVSVDYGKAKRLGKAELGPYAHEDRMPTWLHRLLQEGAKVHHIEKRLSSSNTRFEYPVYTNESSELVPVLARLSNLDETVDCAYFCYPDVHHVAKLPREGGFCGYRNIQMLASYIRNARAPGYEHFQGKLPSIQRLQDMIEHAWDLGFNSSGRIETGGIKHTRKYIGTPEAQALLSSIAVSCEAQAFITTEVTHGSELLLAAVWEYFHGSVMFGSKKVSVTNKPPIYFQHQGHSMTIVGVERRFITSKNPKVNSTRLSLVVFDPMFNPSSALKVLREHQDLPWKAEEVARLLKAHRRGNQYLSRYRDFELLKLTEIAASNELEDRNGWGNRKTSFYSLRGQKA